LISDTDWKAVGGKHTHTWACSSCTVFIEIFLKNDATAYGIVFFDQMTALVQKTLGRNSSEVMPEVCSRNFLREDFSNHPNGSSQSKVD
jgi:hypothetical protein